MRFRSTAVLVAAGWLSGCTVGPNYHRPAVLVPQAFRAPNPLPAPQASSLADLKWWEVFRDEKLQDLIRAALAANYDLRDAVVRVDEARANLSVTRSNQFPQFGASGSVNLSRLSRDGQTPLPASFLPSQNRNWGEGALNLLSFEVDIWGRLRRATEAARANLLTAEENRKAVVVTLVSDVATGYLHLRELDYELEISRATLATRQDSLHLTIDRQSGGVATLLDLRQAEQLVDTAEQTIPGLQQQIEQTENQLTLLLGQNPGGVVRGQDFMKQEWPPRRARRIAVRIARTEAGHPSRRTELGGGQRQYRRGEGHVLSADQSQRISRGAEHAVVEPVQRPAQRLEFCAADFAADFCRRPFEVRREARASRAGVRAHPV
jgi:multidrug efflux system outer membrane protein